MGDRLGSAIVTQLPGIRLIIYKKYFLARRAIPKAKLEMRMTLINIIGLKVTTFQAISY
jgi:hypothetical protein